MKFSMLPSVPWDPRDEPLLADRVGHRQREFAEGVGLELDENLVFAGREVHLVECHVDVSTDGERNRVVLGHLVEPELLVVGRLDGDLSGFYLGAVDADPVHPRELGVLEPVFDLELDTLLAVTEAAERVQPFEDLVRDVQRDEPPGAEDVRIHALQDSTLGSRDDHTAVS